MDFNVKENYRPCHKIAYNCTVKKHGKDERIYDRNSQKILLTTEEECYIVTGPAGERAIYTEEDFLKHFELVYKKEKDTEKKKEKRLKALRKGKLFKATANEEREIFYFWRIPEEEMFVFYDDEGKPTIGNDQSNCSLVHNDGDCIMCPSDERGEPDLSKKHVVNGELFDIRFAPI